MQGGWGILELIDPSLFSNQSYLSSKDKRIDRDIQKTFDNGTCSIRYRSNTFINHLKRTQMPLKKIQEYVKFSLAKNDEACKAILEEHKNQITIQVTNLQATLDLINYKITHFQRIKTGKVTH